MYETLKEKEKSIDLFYVSEQDVQLNNVKVPNLPTIPGTMNIHQVISLASEPGKIFYRDVSCFCASDKVSCSCFDVTERAFFAAALLQKSDITEFCYC